MIRGDTLDLVDSLRRVRDPARVAAALRASKGAEVGAVRDVAGWRLHPLRKGGFAVRLDVVDDRGRRRAVHGVLLPSLDERISIAADAPGLVADLALMVFDPVDDPRQGRLRAIAAGDALRDAGVPVAGTGELVAYRPLTRAVLRFRSAAAPRLGGDAACVYVRSSASGRRYERIRTLVEVAEAFSELFPAPLAALDELRAIAIAELPGETLHEVLGSREDGELPGLAATAGSVLGRLHSTRDAAPLGVHDALDDAEATSWMLRRAALTDPDLLRGVGDDLEKLFELASGVEPERLALIHRDLHDKQIMLGPDGAARFLDTDTLALGDAALDLANLSAHLELRELQGRVSTAARARCERALRDAYAAAARAPLERNLTYYTACTWLRLAGVYALRSSGRELVPALLARGRSALDRL